MNPDPLPPEPEHSDDELITAVRNGDLAAYGVLFRRHAPAAVAYAVRRTRSPADAEDLVSETFVRVLVALRKGGGPAGSSFRAYLRTAIANGDADRWRRNRRLALQELTDQMTRTADDPTSESVTDTDDDAYQTGAALDALQRLPPRWQAALRYTLIDGLTPGQAAPYFGLTNGAMAALAYRARRGLRHAMAPPPQTR